MIKIITKSDLDGLEKLNLPEVMKRYLRDYHGEMLNRLDCQDESLGESGCMFALDSKEVVEAAKLFEFLQKNPPSRVVGMTLFDGAIPIFITQILLFVKGGYAVSIFAQEEHLKDTLEKYYKGKEGENV